MKIWEKPWIRDKLNRIRALLLQIAQTIGVYNMSNPSDSSEPGDQDRPIDSKQFRKLQDQVKREVDHQIAWQLGGLAARVASLEDTFKKYKNAHNRIDELWKEFYTIQQKLDGNDQKSDGHFRALTKDVSELSKKLEEATAEWNVLLATVNALRESVGKKIKDIHDPERSSSDAVGKVGLADVTQAGDALDKHYERLRRYCRQVCDRNVEAIQVVVIDHLRINYKSVDFSDADVVDSFISSFLMHVWTREVLQTSKTLSGSDLLESLKSHVKENIDEAVAELFHNEDIKVLESLFSEARKLQFFVSSNSSPGSLEYADAGSVVSEKLHQTFHGIRLREGNEVAFSTFPGYKTGDVVHRKIEVWMR